MQLIRQKSEYFNLYKMGVISKFTNNQFKNFVTSEIRKAEHSYYLENFRNFKRNMKQSWNLINRLTGRNAISRPLENNFDGDLHDRVETFNDFFSNIGSLLDSRFGDNTYCDRFSLFSPTQFGFRSGLSTSDALIHLTESIY